MASVLKVDKLDPQSGTALEIGTSGDTVTVPTGAGLTVVDEVKTNKISPATGTAFALGDSGDTFTVPSGATIVNSGTATGFGGGKVNQVVQATDDTQISSTSASDDLISVAITPSATSSKVLIFGTLWLGADMNANGGIVLYRDSTAVGASSSQHGSAVGTFWSCDDYFINDNDYTITSFNFNYLDSPSTTSATTYKFSTSSFSQLYFNRAKNAAGSGYANSTIIAMEILA